MGRLRGEYSVLAEEGRGRVVPGVNVPPREGR